MRFTSAVHAFWCAIQEPGKKGREAARRWQAVSEEARHSLAGLEGRLSKPAFRFFTKSSFHDGFVESIKVVDKKAQRSPDTSRWWRLPTNVEILIRHPDTSTPWTLT